MLRQQTILRRRAGSGSLPDRRGHYSPSKFLNLSGLFPAFVLALGACLLLLGMSGCGEAEAPETSTAPVTAEQPPMEPAPEKLEEPEPPAEPSQGMNQSEPMPASEGSYADTVWAAGYEGKLIAGLDGGEYPPYKVSVVREAQRQLAERGLYNGPISGVIDESTRAAIGEFQKQNQIQVSGVPSPETREALMAAPSGDDSQRPPIS